MLLQIVSEQVYSWLQVNYVEFIGVVLSLLCVWFNTKQNILGWPLAMISAVMYGKVFLGEKLYADMILQVVFFVLSAYGWYKWLYGGKNHDLLPISLMPSVFYTYLIGITLIGTAISGYLLDNFTDADIAYIDSFTTIVSLIAQWMLAKKYLENWLIWIGIDIVYVGVYIYKELYMTAGLYFIFIILAVTGYLQWKKSLVENRKYPA